MGTKNEPIFALDIGTRTVVGAVLKPKEDKLILKDSKVIEHKNRAMLDGQIHNIEEVVIQVKKIKKSLEKSCNLTLNKVGIAAAGRALKTINGYHKIEYKTKKEITSKDVKALEFAAVQDAQHKLAAKNENQASGYHFVGYTILQSKVDGIKIGDLVGQKGSKIEVDLVATFLPRIVIDSLLTVIKESNLEIDHLTLEPIAASNLIIPSQMYDFNLALVDIGAGTSDLAITKNGAIIGYAMVPVAGDEITEAICEHYMLNYNTAEKIKRELIIRDEIEVKDILDQKIKLSTTNIIKQIEPKIEELAQLISEKILEVNQQKPQAVMCIGGGSLTPLLKEKLSQNLDLPSNRVGIKDGKELEGIEGEFENLTGTQSITPFGIAVSCKNNKNKANFLDVKINGDLVHLFTLTEPKVSDALLAAEINIKNLKPEPGLALSVEVNGNLKVIKGTLGNSGKILVNGTEANIDTTIEDGDELTVQLGQKGKSGEGRIADVVPKLPQRSIIVNGKEVTLKPLYYMNNERVTADTKLHDRAKINYEIIQTVGEVIEKKLDFSLDEIKSKQIVYTLNDVEYKYQFDTYKILLNGEQVDLNHEINEGDQLVIKENDTKLKIRDIITNISNQNQINIIFNGRNLKVPNKNFELIKNGEMAQLDDLVKNNDNIKYKSGTMKLNQLLDYIDYKIPTSIKGSLIIEKNGTKAKLMEPLSEGDEIDIYVKQKDY